MRQAAALTQQELADRLAWPRETLVNLEHGRRGLTIERLTAIAHALNRPPAIFLLDDSSLVSVVTRLVNEPALLRDVLFFIKTLEDQPPAE
jgi:transcriptional regulator with XRE-family HTH domain